MLFDIGNTSDKQFRQKLQAALPEASSPNCESQETRY